VIGRRVCSPGLYALNKFATITVRSASLASDPAAFELRALVMQVLFWVVSFLFKLSPLLDAFDILSVFMTSKNTCMHSHDSTI
jgi:hypothetical protein